MKMARISKGGQVTIPAEIRRRWGTAAVLVEDAGDALLLRPLPADPIGAALGSLAGKGPPAEQVRARRRREETSVDRRKTHG